MPIELTRQALAGYLQNHDERYLAEDTVFTDTSTGREWRGREAVSGMLHHFYSEAFDADGETTNLIVAEDHGVWEGHFVGRHIGQFAGIPPTGRDVRVPIVVVYDVENGQVKRGRIYMQALVLMQQLGVLPAEEAVLG